LAKKKRKGLSLHASARLVHNISFTSALKAIYTFGTDVAVVAAESEKDEQGLKTLVEFEISDANLFFSICRGFLQPAETWSCLIDGVT